MIALHSAWRWPTAALLLVVAAVHVPLVGEHLQEAPYVGVLFVLLAIACVLLAVAVSVADARVVWAACVAVCLLALVGFLASRSFGLPLLADDVGNWNEPLGFPAVAAEAACVAVSSGVLARSRSRGAMGTAR